MDESAIPEGVGRGASSLTGSIHERHQYIDPHFTEIYFQNKVGVFRGTKADYILMLGHRDIVLVHTVNAMVVLL